MPSWTRWTARAFVALAMFAFSWGVLFGRTAFPNFLGMRAAQEITLSKEISWRRLALKGVSERVASDLCDAAAA